MSGASTQVIQAKIVTPGAADRTTVIGMTGTGKTVLGGHLLSLQNFNKRPWVALDFKNEILWDMVGDPPIRPLKLGSMPGKRGMYRMHVRPDDDDALEDWLWRIWERGNVGLFIDEFGLMPQKSAMKAVLRQGRSKLVPVIACTQRPVDCDREIFTESNYLAVFQLKDVRDYKIVEGFSGKANFSVTLPEHNFYWYDARQNAVFTLKPCPPPDKVAARLRDVVPYSWWF